MITETLAEFIVKTEFADLPDGAVIAAKRLWLDSVAVTMAGAIEPLGGAIAAHAREQGGPAQAVVIGHRFRTSAALAALANGTMAHALDYDDISVTWLGHPSGVVLPAVLALGTRLGISGRRALTAYVVGWEVGASVGRSIRHRVHEAGWHSTSVTGTIAAAAACASLAALNAGRTRIALGMAASMAAGMYANRGTDTKPLHAGNAARNGMMAVDLAARGLNATGEIFDGPGNFCQTLIGEDCDAGRMLDGLGQEWDVISPGGTIKLHACCGASHYCIDALLELMREHRLQAEDVELIECHVPPMVPSILIYSSPNTGLEGKFSMQHSMAAALLYGKAGVAQFTDEAVRRPEVRAAAQKVRYVHPEGMIDSTAEIVAQAHRVVLRLRSGVVVERSCRFFRGRAENPLSRQELVDKFGDCAEPVMTRPQTERVIDVIDRLDSVADIAELDEALFAGK